jgi:hypothetical protein
MDQKKNIFFFDWYENSQIRHFEEFFKLDPQKEKKIQSGDDKKTMVKEVFQDEKNASGKDMDSTHPLFQPRD